LLAPRPGFSGVGCRKQGKRRLWESQLEIWKSEVPRMPRYLKKEGRKEGRKEEKSYNEGGCQFRLLGTCTDKVEGQK
jgi:hypothetical protein